MLNSLIYATLSFFQASHTTYPLFHCFPSRHQISSSFFSSRIRLAAAATSQSHCPERVDNITVAVWHHSPAASAQHGVVGFFGTLFGAIAQFLIAHAATYFNMLVGTALSELLAGRALHDVVAVCLDAALGSVRDYASQHPVKVTFTVASLVLTPLIGPAWTVVVPLEYLRGVSLG